MQTTLPFTREEQTALVDAALERLRPALSACRLRGLRALLGAILTAPRNERGEMPLDALAARLDVDERTVRRQLDAAQALGLVVVERAAGFRRPHVLRLDFDGLRGAARTNPEPRTLNAEPSTPLRSHDAPFDHVETSAAPHVEPSPTSPAFTAAAEPLGGSVPVRANCPNVRANCPNGASVADRLFVLSSPHSPPSRSTDGDEWRGAGAELRRVGIAKADAAIAEARARGLGAADVVAAVATFDANRGKFRSAGALVDFLRSGSWPADGVVDAAELVERRERAAAATLAKREALERRRHDAADDATRLERLHGPTLDGLADADRDALAAATLVAPGLLTAYRGGRWREPGMVRACLLESLDERATLAAP